jgi:uncharacterized membrane protein
MPDLSSFLTLTLGVALVVGFMAAAIALVGHYRELPSFLTGRPRVCRPEAGGCQVLFRTREASLLGFPNALLGLFLYVFLLVGLCARWHIGLLLAGATPALFMSIILARVLLVNQLECRVCWAGHSANLILWLGFLIKLITEN